MGNNSTKQSEHKTIIKCVSKNSMALMQVIVPETDQEIITWLTNRLSATRIDERTYQMPVNYCGTFFRLNRNVLGSYLDALVDSKSLTHYYGIKNWNDHVYPCRTQLTPAFVKKFVDLGDVLIRYELNISNQSTNALGMQIPVFEHRIAEFEMIHAVTEEYTPRKHDAVITRDDIKYNFVARDITEDEAKAFTDALGDDDQIAALIRDSILGQSIEEQDLEQIAHDVNKYEKCLQRTINSLLPEIEAYKAKLPFRDYDCGFTFVKTRDEEILKKYRVLVSNGVRDTLNINIDFPDDYMRCSQSPSILAFIQKSTTDADIQNLYVETLCD